MPLLRGAVRSLHESARRATLSVIGRAFEKAGMEFIDENGDPVEAIKYHMGQTGLHPRDLIGFIGSRNRVHEVLNRRRPLTLKMIWRLHEGLGIPAESLIKLRPDRAA